MTRTALIIAPAVLLASTYSAYNGFVALFGFQTGYFLWFLFKWLFWCLLIPFWLVGPDGLRRMFRSTRLRVGTPAWRGWLLLALPLIVAYGYALPRALPHATVNIVLLSALVALVNGTMEEVLWRGTYVQVFSGQAIWGWLYPSLGFAMWHIAPQSGHGRCGNAWRHSRLRHRRGVVRSLLGMGRLSLRFDSMAGRLTRADGLRRTRCARLHSVAHLLQSSLPIVRPEYVRRFDNPTRQVG